MNLNDWTSHRDHTVQDLWNWVAYTKEWYTNLTQDKVRKLHEEKKEYYRIVGCMDWFEIKEFRNSVVIMDKKLEKLSQSYEWQKTIRAKKTLLSN